MERELTIFREKWIAEIAERLQPPIDRLRNAAGKALQAWIAAGTRTPSPERDAYMAAAAALASALVA